MSVRTAAMAGPSTLAPIDTGERSLAELAYERILTAILDGDFAPGDRLIMDRLAAELGISRTPVRDALRRMEADGLVQPATKGFVIRSLDAADVRAMYEVREPVEGWAARVAATRAADAGSAMADALVGLENVPVDEPSAAYRANRDFHRAIVLAAGNPVLVDCFDTIWGRGLALLSFAESARHGSTVDYEEHRVLHEAVMSGDPDRAEVEMLAHIRRGAASV
ncbi:MAG: GntR family transcriptional regulator [Chloroflexi bacterium]|nr:GntR family transcriptional regulator [Chloroflexota bacterium]MCH2426584.1 GntR family transcriptional regulator [Acidimicrobiales bacterium]MCS5672754.1 GntR family transcriptional regulator [Acidimicrobiales bacterium]